MASARERQRRFEMVAQASLVWGMGDIDIDGYLMFGRMEQSGRGGPVQLRPDLEARVQAEVERIKAENPKALKVKAAR